MLTSPKQYDGLIGTIRERGGTRLEDRRQLALAAFQMTSEYDRAVADYLGRSLAPQHETAAPAMFPKVLECRFLLRSSLRYGENPHQKGAFYVESAAHGPNLATATILHGKELSYNNLLDLDSALRLVRLFAEPAVCILKHNNPCGAAVAGETAVAFERAYEGDPVSAFGGIVAANRPVDRATAERMCQPGTIPGGDPRSRLRRGCPGMVDDQAELAEQRPPDRSRSTHRP